MELQGQVAIINGAGRGIGRATALELARMGADIVVAELDPANAERTASEVRGLGRRAPTQTLMFDGSYQDVAAGPDNRPTKEPGLRWVLFVKTAPIINWPV